MTPRGLTIMPTGDGRWERFDRFYRRHASVFQLVYGAVVLLLATVLLIFALLVIRQRQAEEARDSQETRNIRVECERTREFGPAIGLDEVRRHVFSVRQGHDYFALIPKKCP